MKKLIEFYNKYVGIAGLLHIVCSIVAIFALSWIRPIWLVPIFALLIGVSREIAAEFTFFLAIPVMFGASLLKLVKFGFVFTGFELVVLAVGTIVSFIVSVWAIKFLMGYIKKHDFKVFGWYRIVLGIILLAYFFFVR